MILESVVKDKKPLDSMSDMSYHGEISIVFEAETSGLKTVALTNYIKRTDRNKFIDYDNLLNPAI